MEPADPEVFNVLAELNERYGEGAWEVYRGASGLLYARRYKTSPPLWFRAPSAQELLAQIGEYVSTGRWPDY